MITQEKYDVVYNRITVMRDAATTKRRFLKDNPGREEDYYGAYYREQALSQVLSLLEDADRIA